MTTMKEAVREVLENDATFAALATGGIFDANNVGRNGMTRKKLTVSGQVAMSPGVYITWPTDAPLGQAQKTIGAHNIFFDLYCYQDEGYDITEAMRERALTLFNYTPVTFDTPSDKIMRDIIWAGDVSEQRDDTMGGAAMERSSYQVLTTPFGG